MTNSDDNRKLLQEILIGEFDYIKDKLEDHSKLLSSINIVMAQNTLSLEEHMRRTEAIEERLDFVESDLDPLLDKSKEFKGMAKLIGWVVAASGALYTVWEYLIKKG